jgi:hypothetical protein
MNHSSTDRDTHPSAPPGTALHHFHPLAAVQQFNQMHDFPNTASFDQVVTGAPTSPFRTLLGQTFPSAAPVCGTPMDSTQYMQNSTQFLPRYLPEPSNTFPAQYETYQLESIGMPSAQAQYETYQPESINTSSAQYETYQSEPINPSSAHCDTHQPESINPSSTQYDTYQPESTNQFSTQYDTYQPEPINTSSAQYDTYQSESINPSSAQCDTYQPESINPSSTQYDTYQPESTNQSSTQYDTHQPESTNTSPAQYDTGFAANNLPSDHHEALLNSYANPDIYTLHDQYGDPWQLPDLDAAEFSFGDAQGEETLDIDAQTGTALHPHTFETSTTSRETQAGPVPDVGGVFEDFQLNNDPTGKTLFPFEAVVRKIAKPRAARGKGSKAPAQPSEASHLYTVAPKATRRGTGLFYTNFADAEAAATNRSPPTLPVDDWKVIKDNPAPYVELLIHAFYQPYALTSGGDEAHNSGEHLGKSQDSWIKYQNEQLLKLAKVDENTIEASCWVLLHRIIDAHAVGMRTLPFYRSERTILCSAHVALIAENMARYVVIRYDVARLLRLDELVCCTNRAVSRKVTNFRGNLGKAERELDNIKTAQEHGITYKRVLGGSESEGVTPPKRKAGEVEGEVAAKRGRTTAAVASPVRE